MNPTDYLLPLPPIDWTNALAEWRWMLPPACTPVGLTCFADLFLAFDSSVFLLDLENATLDRYCDGELSLLPTLSQDEDADVLLYVKLVDLLRNDEVNTEPGRCYHFKIPTIIGGGFDIANVGTNTIDERVRFCGDFHKQIKDLPDGTPIQFSVGDDR